MRVVLTSCEVIDMFVVLSFVKISMFNCFYRSLVCFWYSFTKKISRISRSVVHYPKVTDLEDFEKFPRKNRPSTSTILAPCTDVHKPKKIKNDQNASKHSKTILETIGGHAGMQKGVVTCQTRTPQFW